MPEHVHILGVRVDAVTEPDVLEFVRERIRDNQPAHVVTVNVEYVMRAREDERFARALGNADLATPDSAGIVWAMQRRGVSVRRRVGGSDLIWSISSQAARSGHRLFLLGARPGVAERAGRVLSNTYPGLTVAGAHAGSPAASERAFIVDLIRQSRADIIFVAFGSPQQDLWIADNLPASGASVAMGVGGSMDYVAGTAHRAPVWMQEHNVEWVWRLLREPWRWRRMLAIPRFMWAARLEEAKFCRGERENA